MSEHENAPGRRRMTLADAEDRIEATLRDGGRGPVTEADVQAAHLVLQPRTYLVMCGAVRRAMDLVAELDSQRTIADLERVQHGVSHELETLARVLEIPQVRGRHADVTIVDDAPLTPDRVPLPFD